MRAVDNYLDDLKVGDRFESPAGYTLTEADIIDFALCYDPQPFHIDVEAAKQTHFSGLIASGFQTMALGFRVIYGSGFITTANLGGIAMEEVRWLKPMRPGDTLRSVAEITEVTPSKSNPDRGICKYLMTVTNQHGDPVFSGVVVIVMKRRRP
jgi:acyl dehydratase